MSGKNICSETDCVKPSIGYIPMSEDAPARKLCAGHYDEAALAGYFLCLNGETVCPECEGRAGFSKTIRCVHCHSSGVVADTKNRTPCTRCKGTGFTSGRRGRPTGWTAKT